MDDNDQKNQNQTQNQDNEQTNLDINPARVQEFLGGINYPCSKEQLLDKARQEGAPERVLNMLEGIDDKSYDSPADLSQELGRII